MGQLNSSGVGGGACRARRVRPGHAAALSAAVAAAAATVVTPAHRALATDPSANEQYLLELLNRMRINPAGELHKLVNISGNPASFGNPISNDPDVANALLFFGVDANTLATQWSTLTPAAPLAWNRNLGDAATGHNNLMIANDAQSHQFPGEPDIVGRATNAGYVNWSNLGENVYAYSKSMFYGHAGFAIDWGPGPGGIQSPPGHRQNIMSTNFAEVGIAVGTGPGNGDGMHVGPYVITQDFGRRFFIGPFLTGVAYSDTTTVDDFYTPGEGLSGVLVQAFTAGTASVIGSTNTTSSGGYAMGLAAGTYDIKLSGGTLANPITYRNVVVGTNNVKIDTLSSWITDADAAWTNAANWSAGMPNGLGTVAVLGVNTTANRTVSVAGPVTVGTLKFDSVAPVGYNVAGPGTITMDVAGGSALINVATPSSQTVSAGLVLNHNTTVAVASGGTLTLSGSFGINAGNTATYSGPGVLNVGGPQAHGAGSVFTLNAGTVNFSSNAGSPASRTLALNANTGSAVNFNASQDLASLSVGGAAAIGNGGSRIVTANAFSMSGTGRLDLNNNSLVTSTPAATIKGYLNTAYTVNQDWSGNSGITSSFARANPTKYSVGYANGSDQSAIDAGIAVAPGQTLVHPVLVGDANMDGRVDFFDISQLLGYKYNAGGTTASYTDGDLDYNGKVDFFDLSLVLSANYNTGETFPAQAGGSAAKAGATLTGSAHTASSASSAIAQATTVGTVGDGKPDFVYNPATGHLTFATDGGVFTTTGGAPSFVSSLTISSASGELIGAGASSTFAGGTGATLTSTLLSSALTNSPGFTDGFDIGAVLPTGLTIAQLTADLTLKYQSLNGGSLKASDLLVPEPSGVALLGLGALGLLKRRAHRRGPMRHDN
jgi:uncharacterized protein YkwD